MKSVQEALDIMMPAFAPVGAERVMIADALGRYLGEDVVARSNIPPFDNSSMDGYAVVARDTEGATPDAPRVLVCIGESKAGSAPSRLSASSAMRIFTGAIVPEGADAVVMQEDTAIVDGRVAIHRAVNVGAYIRRRAKDLARGSALLMHGARLGPGEIGILAAQGFSSVTVYRKPRVAIVSTGDELRDIDEPGGAGSIINSNAYALAAMVREAGCEPVVLPNVPDDMNATLAALRAGLTADVLLTCGGVSVGDYDYVRAAFDSVGINAGFWKVRIKPGKPLAFGLRGTTPVVGLPGNPMSAMVTFEALVRPGLRKMLGDPKPYRVKHEIAMGVDHTHAKGRLELVRARVSDDEVGKRVAVPLKLQDAGSLPSWVGVDALLLFAEDRATYAAGEVVGAIFVRDETGSGRSPFG
jgi:molybdopterin molybdotransferase